MNLPFRTFLSSTCLTAPIYHVNINFETNIEGLGQYLENQSYLVEWSSKKSVITYVKNE